MELPFPIPNKAVKRASADNSDSSQNREGKSWPGKSCLFWWGLVKRLNVREFGLNFVCKACGYVFDARAIGPEGRDVVTSIISALLGGESEPEITNRENFNSECSSGGNHDPDLARTRIFYISE